MDCRVRCLMAIWDMLRGLEHWTRRVSWLVDLHPGLLGVELRLRCGRDLLLISLIGSECLGVPHEFVYGIDNTDWERDHVYVMNTHLER